MQNLKKNLQKNQKLQLKKMIRFTDLLKTGEVHSAYENVTQTTTVDVDNAPASVEDPVNPEPLNFHAMSKLELETYGRAIGIELDRRHNKLKLIKQLENYIDGH